MTPTGHILLLWGVGAVVVSLIQAVWRLTPMMLAAPTHPDFGALHVVAGVAWVVFMAWSEGYRGFQRRFSPMVVARGLVLVAEPTPLRVLLAPFFCMGLFHATRRRLVLSWGLLIGVLILVLLVRQLPQPWRGVVDAGVVVGLTWGALATVIQLGAALAGRMPEVSAEVPEAVTDR